MAQSGEQGQEVTLTPWDPHRFVRKVDPHEVRYSRGFSRCRPEKWFPGFGAQWLPLAHSLGVDVKVLEAKPVLVVPRTLKTGFAGTVDDEPIAVFADEPSMDVILEAVSPGIATQASSVVAEYMARRFLASLALSWSGPEASVVRFDTAIDPHQVPVSGAVRFSVEINGSPATIWILMGKLLVERLDGLWRRQVRSASKMNGGDVEVRLEVGQLAVPPSMLVDYMRSGSIVDLEILCTDLITLRHSGKGWLPGRLCSIGGNLGFEVVPGPVASQALPEGTTRLSIEFGTVRFDAALLSEMAQVGALYDTGIKLTDRVMLSINNEKVGEATLCVFEGRFAISVD
jgi:hypothetical protein